MTFTIRQIKGYRNDHETLVIEPAMLFISLLRTIVFELRSIHPMSSVYLIKLAAGYGMSRILSFPPHPKG